MKTDFEQSGHRFDQCGIVMYLDSENWLKASVEYENSDYQHLGSVVTNGGYSDWATTEIAATVKTMWYRLSRREDDYRIECSYDGVTFSQMRYATCSAARAESGSASTRVRRRTRRLPRCSATWSLASAVAAHNGQQPYKRSLYTRTAVKARAVHVARREKSDILNHVS